MARIAVLLAEDFEDSELLIPLKRLREAGHDVVLVGEDAGSCVYGKADATEAEIDVDVDDVSPHDFDALLIPGGYSPDHLRLVADAVDFVSDFARSGKPVAAVCHGPQLLISAHLVRGKRMTSWPSVRVDLENAGATWLDAEVVVDDNLITSRGPDDLEAFSQELIQHLSRHRPRQAPAADPAQHPHAG